MATRAKPAKGAERATRRRGSKEIARDGTNGVTEAAVREYLDQLHSISDRMEEDSATSRGDINAVYDRAADALDVNKDALSSFFKEERRRRKAEAKAAKSDTRWRESMSSLAQAFGDSPMGGWALNLANQRARETAERVD